MYLCVVEVGRGGPVLVVKVPVDGAVAWRASIGRSDGGWSGVVKLGSGRDGGGSSAVVDEEGTGSSKVVLVLEEAVA